MIALDALDTLIGGYLNEDWYIDFGDPWAAVERFVLWEPDYAPAVRADIDALLARCTTNDEVERVLDKFGLGYDVMRAGWQSYRQWLLAVADRVDQLRTSPTA